MQMRMHELREVYKEAAESAQEYDLLHQNLPLNAVSRLERPYRKLFLDHPKLVGLSHKFYTQYSEQYPHILTAKANLALQGIRNLRGEIGIVEINIPQFPEGLHRHRTEIDLVSFLPIKDTIRLLEDFVSSKGLPQFSLPVQKGQIAHRYWSSRVSTTEQLTGKTEETLVKLRKRIHGTGYTLDNEEVRALKHNHKYTDRQIYAFAE